MIYFSYVEHCSEHLEGRDRHDVFCQDHANHRLRETDINYQLGEDDIHELDENNVGNIHRQHCHFFSAHDDEHCSCAALGAVWRTRLAWANGVCLAVYLSVPE
jgi:hypothetical protein